MMNDILTKVVSCKGVLINGMICSFGDDGFRGQQGGKARRHALGLSPPDLCIDYVKQGNNILETTIFGQ